jgi:hypothetical protein
MSGKITTKKVDLQEPKKQSKEDAEEEAKNPTTVTGQIDKAKNDYVAEYGWIGLILSIAAIVGVIGGIYYGYHGSHKTPLTGEVAKTAAVWTRHQLYVIAVKLSELLGWILTYVVAALKWSYESTLGIFTMIWSGIISFWRWVFGILPGVINVVKEKATAAIEKAAEKRADMDSNQPKQSGGASSS